MPRFWTHPGANYVVNVDDVSYAWAEDVERSQGNRSVVQTHLTFVLSGGSSTRTSYQDRAQRDEALRLFCEFVGASAVPPPEVPPRAPTPRPDSARAHEPILTRREVGGHRLFLWVGCSCGWRVGPDEPNPDDAFALHVAAARVTEQ